MLVLGVKPLKLKSAVGVPAANVRSPLTVRDCGTLEGTNDKTGEPAEPSKVSEPFVGTAGE